MSDSAPIGESIPDMSPDDIPVIPGFEFVARLGHSHLFETWKAEQLSLHRPVIIKIFSHNLSRDDEAAKYFLSAVTASSELKHPHIVQVYDFGRCLSDNRCYFVLEYIAGYSVGDWLKRKGVIAQEDTLLVAESVAQALRYAWDKRRLAHGNIQPDNIMIDSDGTVKVADLGLAQAIMKMTAIFRDSAGADDLIIGTPNYMSPEQVRGDTALDDKADMYSLGASLYHVMSGHMPFEGKPVSDVMENHLTEHIPDPRIFNPDITYGAARLIQQLMAKNRDARYPIWKDVIEDIRLVHLGTVPLCESLKSENSTVLIESASAEAPVAVADASEHIQKIIIEPDEKDIIKHQPGLRGWLARYSNLFFALTLAGVIGYSLFLPRVREKIGRSPVAILVQQAWQSMFHGEQEEALPLNDNPEEIREQTAIGPRDQQITEFMPASGTAFKTTDKAALSAKSGSALPVAFELVSGPGTLAADGTLAFAGEGAVLVKAVQAGNENWNAAAEVTNTYTVAKAAAQVTLGDLAQVYDAKEHKASAATVPEKLAVEFMYNGTAALPMNAGSYAVSATVNDAMYQGVATGTLVIAKADQTLTEFIPAAGTAFASTNKATLSAKSGSGLAVAFEFLSGPGALAADGTLTFTGEGAVLVKAVEAGNENWNAAAPVSNTYAVGKAIAVVTLSDLAQVYDGKEHKAEAATMPEKLAVEITYNGAAALPVAAGNHAVVATVKDVMYQGVATGTLVIAKAEQTITEFMPASGTAFASTNKVMLSAKSGSALAVVFELVSGPGVVAADGTLTFTGEGAVVVKAMQAGNENWNPAAPVSNTYTVGKAAAQVTLGNLAQVYDAKEHKASAATVPEKLTVELMYNDAAALPVKAGSYTVVAIVKDVMYQGAVTGTLVIAKAEQTITEFMPAPGTAFKTTDKAALSAKSGSALPVVFELVSGPGAVAADGTLTFTGEGAVVVKAVQAGNENWNAAAPVMNTYAVKKIE